MSEQELLKATAGRLRVLITEHRAAESKLGAAVEESLDLIFDVLDPPPEPSIPPGELVMLNVGLSYPFLRITVDDPHIQLLEGLSSSGARAGNRMRLANAEDVQNWVKCSPDIAFEVFQRYARLLVSQEQPPELRKRDKENWKLTGEKRIAIVGEWFLSEYRHPVKVLADTELPVWIVEKK